MQCAFPITAYLLATALLVAGTLRAQADAPLFEDIHVVSLPVKTYGYRGMPGDIIALKDGRLLLAYTRMDEAGNADGAIAARYSADQGKTWAEEFILIPANSPRHTQDNGESLPWSRVAKAPGWGTMHPRATQRLS